MAANKSLRVVCSDEVHGAVDAMARASGQSRSAVVARLLEQISPKMKELAEAMEAAKVAPDRLAQAVGAGLSEAAGLFRAGTPNH